MITVVSENLGIALVHSERDPKRAVVCHYENHGNGALETRPLEDNGRVVYMPVDPGADTPGLLAELHRLLPKAAALYEMTVTAHTLADMRPEDIGLPKQ